MLILLIRRCLCHSRLKTTAIISSSHIHFLKSYDCHSRQILHYREEKGIIILEEYHEIKISLNIRVMIMRSS